MPYENYIFDWGNTLMVDFPSEKGPMYAWPEVQAVPGAEDLLRELSRFSDCFIATNAKDSSEADIRRALARVRMDRYISDIFCYMNTGVEKPDKAFFLKIYSKLKADKKQTVLIGDSLEKDIYGALDFGFDAIWFNAGKKSVPDGIKSVTKLSQIIGF